MISSISAPTSVESSSINQLPRSEDLVHMGQLIFLNQIHQLVMEGWRRFAENQSEIRERRDAGDRLRQQNHIPMRVTGEVAQRLYTEDYRDDASRHLNFPV